MEVTAEAPSLTIVDRSLLNGDSAAIEGASKSAVRHQGTIDPPL